MRIRGARPDDRAAIEGVTLAAYQQYAAVMPAHWEAYRENILSTLAAAALETLIVADDEGRLSGSVVLYPAGTVLPMPRSPAVALEWPEVRLLTVAPEARGRGVGAALMQACIGRARRAGAAALTLHTTDMMEAAVRLYERLGFQRAPALDLEPAPGVTVKGYRLALQPEDQ